MRETLARLRAPEVADGKANEGAKRDEVGRFTAKPGDETSAARAKPEPGQPSDEGEGRKSGEKMVREADLVAVRQRETEKRKAIAAQNDELTLRLSKTEAGFKLALEQIERLSKALQAGQQFDPRDEQVRRYELAEAARTESQRIERAQVEARQAKEAEAQAAAESERFETAMRTEIEEATGKFPLASLEEVAIAIQREPSKDALSLAKSIHERKMKAAGLAPVPPPSPPAPTVPTTSRATSNGPSSPMFATHDKAGMMATLRALRASSKGV